jgi:hypothetical protein
VGEPGPLAEAGVDVPSPPSDAADEIEVELRILERMLADASAQARRLRELLHERQTGKGGRDE